MFDQFSGSSEFNKGEESSTTNPYAPTMDDLDAILGYSAELFEQSGGINAENPLRGQGANKLNAVMQGAVMKGAADVQYQDILSGAEQLWSDELAQDYTDSAQQGLNQQLASQDVMSTGTGNSGSSRSGLTASATTSQAQQNLDQQFAQMRQDNLDTSMAKESANTKTQLMAGAGLGKTADKASAMEYQNKIAKQMGGWDNLNRYLSVVGSIAGMGQSTDSESSGQSHKMGYNATS